MSKMKYGETIALTIICTMLVLLTVVPKYDEIYAYLGAYSLGWIPGFLWVRWHNKKLSDKQP